MTGDKPEQAIALLAEIPFPEKPEFRAGYLHVRGYALAHLTKYRDAKPVLEEARAVAAGAHLAPLESTVLVHLGTVLFFLDDRTEAKECYRLALARADASRDSYLQA